MTTPRIAEKRPTTATAKASQPASETATPEAKKPSGTARVSEAKKPSGAEKTRRPGAGPAGKSPKGTATAASGGRTITVTLPGLGEAATWAVDAVAGPVAIARRALTARRGLPVYAGLGALAVVGALEWPLAVGMGIGYAVLRSKGLPTRQGS
ncbi:hypothetical protein [Streptomyces glomeratus]|uniref:Uncharacterized protein n=1 Tax=Streptomyces glomeratus TaxID=284452 RepID=A0ABP6KYC3_9ACTN|nr:hypothetical protein [Streptomyces glomeratus]MCF1511686.1 hypothetical protein [Streptomyces glomeratus]